MGSNGEARGRQTRLKVQQALRRLTLTGSYDAITVEAICREAKVSRSTFYGHFAGKDAVKAAAIAAHLSADIEEALRAASGFHAILQALFAHAHQHRSHYAALRAGPGKTVALSAIEAVLAEKLFREAGIRPRANEARIQRPASVRFAVAGVLALLVDWLDRPKDSDPHTVVDQASEFVGKVLAII